MVLIRSSSRFGKGQELRRRTALAAWHFATGLGVPSIVAGHGRPAMVEPTQPTYNDTL